MITKTTKIKKYSLSYWVKQALSGPSNHNNLIADTVREHASNPDRHAIAFDGTPHELLNELYLECRKRLKSVQLGLFPTPMPVARQLAELMEIRGGMTIFDPCAGTGNLLIAAQERNAVVHGMEYQQWLPDILAICGLPVAMGDYLENTPPHPGYDAVIVNPPYGRIGNSTDAVTDFLDAIADRSPRGTLVGAILPAEHFERGPKKRMATAERFHVLHTERLPEGTFKPLTGVSTSMQLLKVA